MLRAGYFSHTAINVSETFIFDLLASLHADSDIDLTYYSGSRTMPNVPPGVRSHGTGFAERYSSLRRIARTSRKLAVAAARLPGMTDAFLASHTLARVVREDIDVAYIDYATSAVILRRFLSNRQIRFVVHVHGYDVTASAKDAAYRRELELVFASANAVICASQYMRRLVIFLGCDPAKAMVIRYGLDSDAIQPMDREMRLREGPSIVHLGRLVWKKHPIALLHAFRLVLDAVPDAKLAIIGDGHLRDSVDREIVRLGLSHSVSRYGALPRQDAFPIMMRHWVYAQHSVTAPSGDQEGFAISLAEAALHGLPVVSTIHNGIPEQVIEGETGFLVPEFDFEAMAERLIELLDDPELCKRMGEHGRANIIEICRPDVRAARIKQLLAGNAQ